MPNVRNDQYVNSGPGAVGPEQAEIESVVTGSMPTANRISVTKNPDGTIQTHVSITDATPTTGPVSSQRASTPTDPLGPAAVGVQTGWVEIGDRYKYYKEDGSGFLTGWHSEENADTTLTWYYFDRAPENLEWMVTGWKLVEGADGVERWYYMEKDGRMEIYWLTLTYKDHDKDVVRWYYLQPDGPGQGYMITDWMTINGDWYYFKPDGSDAGYMLTGWYLVKGKWYYSYEDDEKRGIMAANHMIHHTDGKDYYVGSDGAMLTSTVFQSEEDGETYTADGKGVCTLGKTLDLESILVGNGYTSNKAHAMAIAYDVCKVYSRNFAVGMMANIFHEGAAGVLEGKNNAKYWDIAPQSISDLAGKTVKNESMARTWLNETPRVSGFGVGSIQWSWPSRRDGILKEYLSKAQTWSVAELGGIEVQFMVSELNGTCGYDSYKKIIPSCQGKSVEFCTGYLCEWYESPSNAQDKAVDRKKTGAKLDNLLSKYGY